MTTIVANRECMAADQRVTGDGPICHATKLRRIGASVYGIAGSVFPATLLLDWIASGAKDRSRLHRMLSEDARESFDVLELSAEGLAVWNGWGVRIPLHDECYAIGSGSMSALQALRSGSTPADAIRMTFHLDECSGGSVEVMPLAVKKRKR